MDIKTYISSGIIEAYVLGTSSPEESSILECVMQNNPEVKAAVAEYQQILEDFATKTAIAPPSHLKLEILKKLDFAAPVENPAKIIPLNTTTQKQIVQNPISIWLKAASVAVLFGVGYLAYEVNTKNSQLQQVAQNNIELSTKISSLEQMNTMLLNSKKIELKGVERHPALLAEVYMNADHEVFLNPKNLPAAPSGKSYQLWAIVDGKPVDMGVYDSKKDSVIQEMKSVKNPQAFAITLEKEGGNPTPTMEEMYVMGEV